jgi:hypothetical protein
VGLWRRVRRSVADRADIGRRRADSTNDTGTNHAARPCNGFGFHRHFVRQPGVLTESGQSERWRHGDVS